MKRKVIVALVLTLILACALAISISAATTNEFAQTPTTLENIDLTNMSTDTTARVVLMHEVTVDGVTTAHYTTYPSQYIVKSSGDFAIDYSKINAALSDKGISYAAGSVIRIEIPTTVKKQTTVLNGNGSNSGKNLVEVVYPANSQVTELVWGAFMKCTNLEKINIPASVTLLGQDCFSSCSVLTSVTFDENSSLTTINKTCFGSCISLEEIVLPNTVTKIGNEIFYNCKKLERVVLGAGLTTTDGGLLGAAGYNDNSYFAEIYMPAGFATGEGSIASGNILGRGNNGDLKKYVIFFTGTQAQAEALVSKYSADPNIKGANIVAYDPEKGNNKASYIGLDACTDQRTVDTNRVIVFGYNMCDAFYNSDHKNSEVSRKFEGLPYVSNYVNASTCQRCEKNFVVGEAISGPLFKDKGYSKSADGTAFTYGISLYESEIQKYEAATGNIISYGFILGLAGTEAESGKIVSSEGEALVSNSVITNFADVKYNSLNIYNLKVTKVESDAQRALSIYCNAYVIENGKVSYIGSLDKNEKPLAIMVKDLPTEK